VADASFLGNPFGMHIMGLELAIVGAGPGAALIVSFAWCVAIANPGRIPAASFIVTHNEAHSSLSAAEGHLEQSRSTMVLSSQATTLSGLRAHHILVSSSATPEAAGG
jgi:hypothetical protein